MCGITGFYSFGKSIDANFYYEAHLTISHRGPDDEGFFCINNDNESVFASGLDSHNDLKKLKNISEQGELSLVLGHRRLSIIDLSSAGHQPFFDGNTVLIFNGEIYNYLELRDELSSLGVSFKTTTDTEVFLAAYSYWREEAFSKFNGMWAAAIYNVENRELILVRDRFGVKPLYYLSNNDGFYFSSEIKYFKRLNLISDINENAIYQYLRFSETDFDESTFFNNVYQVEPGCYIKIASDHVIKESYWGEYDLDSIENPSERCLSDQLFDAIRIRLRSDVAVGSLLSGGIDSSLIVGFIKKLQGLDGFQSYSAVFSEEEFSEKKYIDDNSNFLGFSPRFIYPNSEDLVENIEKLIYIQEMPFRSLSVLSQFLIYQEVSRDNKVKVLLNGQGADEIFTGYDEHYSFYFWGLLKKMRFILLFQEVLAYSKNKNSPLWVVFYSCVKTILSTKFYKNDKHRFFKKSFKRVCEESIKSDFSSLKKRLYRNLSFSALREYLRYEDRNSMFFSLESRLPFLDFRLVKLAFSIDDKYLIKGGVTKAPLRNLCIGKVTPAIINRKDKTGFVSPQELWQKTSLSPEFDKIFDEIELYGLFDFINTDSISKFYQDYKLGRHNDWALIWRIYCLYKWKKIWINF